MISLHEYSGFVFFQCSMLFLCCFIYSVFKKLVERFSVFHMGLMHGCFGCF